MSSFVFGAWRDAVAIDAELIGDARAARAPPFAEILALLDQLDPLWQRGGSSRERWLGTFPERELGWSRPMIELGLDQFARRLDRKAASARISSQLGSAAALERPAAFDSPGTKRVYTAPFGIVLQVVAANIFFGPAEALLAGLITGNTNLIKQPAGDAGFLAAFLRSIEEVDPRALAATAVLEWRGGEKAIESFLGTSVDAILIAAGPDAVRAWRQLAAPAAELIELGPRVSIAVVSRAGFASASAQRTSGASTINRLHSRSIVDALARDVALWEQCACGSPQAIYVEGRELALALAEQLANGLGSIANELPEAKIDLDTRAAIAQFRDGARYGGRGERLFASLGYASVLFEEGPEFSSPPLYRNVVIKPYNTLEELGAALDPIRGFLQTAGLCVTAKERSVYINRLIAAGARRFCPLGEMATPAPEIAGDGMHELSRLVRHVVFQGSR